MRVGVLCTGRNATCAGFPADVTARGENVGCVSVSISKISQGMRDSGMREGGRGGGRVGRKKGEGKGRRDGGREGG